VHSPGGFVVAPAQTEVAVEDAGVVDDVQELIGEETTDSVAVGVDGVVMLLVAAGGMVDDAAAGEAAAAGLKSGSSLPGLRCQKSSSTLQVDQGDWGRALCASAAKRVPGDWVHAAWSKSFAYPSAMKQTASKAFELPAVVVAVAWGGLVSKLRDVDLAGAVPGSGSRAAAL